MTKACLLAVLCLLVGCDELDNCPEGKVVAPITDGFTDTEALVYDSARWGGTSEARRLDHFPPDSDLHFIHGLGVTPTFVHSYLSFSAEGTNGAGAGDATENAGNQGRIQCVDAYEIVITNDTCEEDFYIRVVASASGSEPTERVCTPPDQDE